VTSEPAATPTKLHAPIFTSLPLACLGFPLDVCPVYNTTSVHGQEERALCAMACALQGQGL
jgi:hypothetical protein